MYVKGIHTDSDLKVAGSGSFIIMRGKPYQELSGFSVSYFLHFFSYMIYIIMQFCILYQNTFPFRILIYSSNKTIKHFSFYQSIPFVILFWLLYPPEL